MPSKTFKVVSLTGPEFVNKARLAGLASEAPSTFSSLSPLSWDYKHKHTPPHALDFNMDFGAPTQIHKPIGKHFSHCLPKPHHHHTQKKMKKQFKK